MVAAVNIRTGRFLLSEQLDWRHWVTPKQLKSQPIHRWFAFPHSFTGELVESLIEEWGLDENDEILDPFVGAGTTLVAAREKGIPATGYDLSPLAVLCSEVKVSDLDATALEQCSRRLDQMLSRADLPKAQGDYPSLVKDALPASLLDAFEYASRCFHRLPCDSAEKSLLRLALLSVMPEFSRAEASGGWLKWVTKRTSASRLRTRLIQRIQVVIDDIRNRGTQKESTCIVRKIDARSLPDRHRKFSAVITSPPYPNRHDYTRVFGVELMFGFLSWQGTRRLRYQSFHSHPEARPVRKRAPDYRPPAALARAVRELRHKKIDPRVPTMLEGYFLDMYLCMREIRRVTRAHSPIALVVGNAQFAGIPIPVDELTAEVGERAGLRCHEIRVVRFRGNSAQQMKDFGRRPSRESIVLFERI